MDKNRASTIQQRFGFMDNDLKGPMHDVIMAWLDGEIAAGRIGPSFRTAWTGRDFRDASRPWGMAEEQFVSIANHLGSSALPQVPRPPFRLKRRTWESPIMSHQYVVGFIDLAVEYEEPFLHLERPGSDYQWDVMWTQSNPWYFEVKTVIESVGELIRQIRLYQAYTQGTWVVVCPDDTYKAILKSQGILLIKAPK
jgi:hypothetical protein